MESASDVQMQHCAEDSETTIEIKIKTLDSQTYNLRVNKCVPVPLLKEKIATVTGILSEQQRLICRGRVLKDDELLSAYHVEDGHTLHLVVRQPGQSAPSGNAGTEANASNSGRRRGPTVARSVVLEAVNVDPGSSELPAFVAQIIQSVLGSISTQSSGAPASSDTRPSEPTQSSIPNTVRVELDQQQAPLFFQSEPAHGSSQPNVIPDALTTMSHYIDFMRDSFRREGFNHNAQVEGNVENGTAGSTSVGGTQNQESQPESTSTLGLHTASLLAETMHSTRQIVVEQAGALLSQLSAQLGDLQNLTDPAARRDLQSSALRSGTLLHNLGSLLLELGRTTMLLRINPASSEAVVNSGPALYISPSGPNPLMVQPVPFLPGRSVQMGTLFSGLGSQGSVLHPRDVDVHIRTGGSVPVTSTNPSEPTGAQANRTGEALHANIGEPSAGVAGGTPFSVESGVRLLPLRTVVAMPAGISRAPSGSSSGGVGIIYPLITRVRQRANTSGNEERNGQSPNEPARSSTHPNQQSIPQSSQAHEAGNLGSAADVNVGNGSETSHGQQDGLVALSQIMDLLGSMLPGENVRGNSLSQQAPMASAEQVDGRNSATTHVSGASEEALRFAGMVRQIMPFICQVETQNQSVPADTSAQVASGSGVQFGWALQLSLLTPYIQTLGIDHAMASFIWLCGPITGFVVQPCVGVWSDKCRSKYGRRRPFILAGCLMICAAVTLIGFSADLGYILGDTTEHCRTFKGSRFRAAIVFILGFWMLDLANNTVQGPARALLADLSGPDQCNSANAIFCSWMAVGNILGFSAGASGDWHRWFPFLTTRACCEACANLKAAFLVAVVFLLFCMSVTLYFAEEVPLEPNDTQGLSDSAPLLNGSRDDGHALSEQNNERFPNGHVDRNNVSANSNTDEFTDVNSNLNKDNGEVFSDGPGTVLVNILTSMRHLPPGMHSVLLVMALTWLSWFPFFLFDTDWMGREVYHGDPNGDLSERKAYDNGVREGAFGLLLNSVVLGIGSFLVDPLCRLIGARLVWAISNFTVFICMMATTILSWISSDLYSSKLHHIIGANKTVKNAALVVFSLLGLPLSITYSVPFSVTAELTAGTGGGQGLATGVLNLAIVVPQIVVSLGAGPWDALYGGGNIPAFALASIFSLAAGVLAVLKLPKLSNSYQSAGFHGFG